MSVSNSVFPNPQTTWTEIFGNSNPVEVEIGPGKGGFLLALARNYPERNFFGVEFSQRRAFRLARLLESECLANAIVIRADMVCVARSIVPPNSVATYHLYFPDPWWKRRHHRRRLFRDDFIAAVAWTLVPGGTIFLASDVPTYFTEITRQFVAEPGFTQFSWQRNQVTKKGKPILTDFERKYRAEGRPVLYTAFRKNG